jgi:CheY-like chemotaxis protein
MIDLGAARPAILIVDDELIVGEAMGRMVQRLLPAANIRVVASAAQALDVLRAQMVDVVLTDLHMPGIDGAQLTQTIKARWNATRVILISGSTDEALGKVAQADGYLIKPFSRAELAAVVQPLLRH